MTLAAGQRWSYRAPAGFEASRMIIGALVSFTDSPPIVCCAVSGAPRRLPDGTVDIVTIPFLPMSEQAFGDSIVAMDGVGNVEEVFAEAFAAWHVEVLIFHQRRVGDPRADADGFVIGLGLVDIMHDKADMVQFIENLVHTAHSLTGTV